MYSRPLRRGEGALFSKSPLRKPTELTSIVCLRRGCEPSNQRANGTMVDWERRRVWNLPNVPRKVRVHSAQQSWAGGWAFNQHRSLCVGQCGLLRRCPPRGALHVVAPHAPRSSRKVLRTVEDAMEVPTRETAWYTRGKRSLALVFTQFLRV